MKTRSRCVYEAVDPSGEVPLPLPGLYSSGLINVAAGNLPSAARLVSM